MIHIFNLSVIQKEKMHNTFDNKSKQPQIIYRTSKPNPENQRPMCTNEEDAKKCTKEDSKK